MFRLFTCASLAVWLVNSSLTFALDNQEEQKALHQQAVQLVEQLGSDAFRYRQRAERELAAMGLPAKNALLEGLTSRDAEIRDRCRRLLVVVLEQDYQARVSAFAADTQGLHDHHLPGWERFRQLAGETAASRQLFVEMQRAESKLLELATADPDAASETLLQRCEELQQFNSRQMDNEGRSLSLGNIAAAFFVGSDPRVPVNDRVASFLYNFSYQPVLQTAISGRVRGEPLKRILGAWVDRTASSNHAYQGMVLSIQYDLREGLKPAVSMLKQVSSPPHFVQFAIVVVGRFGGKEHLPLLEALLENKSALVTQNVGGQQLSCEVRDVALATLVYLTKQDHKAYGFNHLQKNSQMLFNANTVGFPNAEARAEAIRKWKTWSAQQPGAPG
jgi:hypothetical protein